jgi:hypothetical protein
MHAMQSNIICESLTCKSNNELYSCFAAGSSKDCECEFPRDRAGRPTFLDFCLKKKVSHYAAYVPVARTMFVLRGLVVKRDGNVQLLY